jgi:hypothetical protein
MEGLELHDGSVGLGMDNVSLHIPELLFTNEVELPVGTRDRRNRQ